MVARPDRNKSNHLSEDKKKLQKRKLLISIISFHFHIPISMMQIIQFGWAKNDLHGQTSHH